MSPLDTLVANKWVWIGDDGFGSFLAGVKISNLRYDLFRQKSLNMREGVVNR